MQGTDGDLYGTTAGGPYPGPHSFGTVFKIVPDRGMSILYTFCSLNACLDGANPLAGPHSATSMGRRTAVGANNLGSVLQFIRYNMLTTLHSFCCRSACTDGYQPW